MNALEAERDNLTDEAVGLHALLRDAADLVSLALRAVEIGAFPGPAWRERAGELAKVVS